MILKFDRKEIERINVEWIHLVSGCSEHCNTPSAQILTFEGVCSETLLL